MDKSERETPTPPDIMDNNNNSETSDKIYDSVVTNEGNVNDKNSTLGEEKTTVQIQSAARQKQPAALIENMKSEEKDAIDSLLAEREVHENLNILIEYVVVYII